MKILIYSNRAVHLKLYQVLLQSFFLFNVNKFKYSENPKYILFNVQILMVMVLVSKVSTLSFVLLEFNLITGYELILTMALSVLKKILPSTITVL